MLSGLVVRFKTAWNAVYSGFRNLLDAPAVPFVVTYRIPTRLQFPPDFEVSRYRGLVLCHLTRSVGSQSDVITYWASQTHYGANGQELSKALNLPLPDVLGVLVDVKLPTKKWWKQLSLKDWVISAAAVCTALALLRVDFATLMEPPDAEVAFADLSPLNVTGGTPVSLQITVLNGSTYATTNLRQITGLISPLQGGNNVFLAPDQFSVPNLTAGQSSKVTLTGFAPMRHEEAGSPEIYNVKVSASARTGIFRRRKEISTPASKELLIWPSNIGWGDVRINRGAGQDGGPDDIAQITVFLFPGKPYNNGERGNLLVVSASDEISRLIVAGQQGLQLDSTASSSVTHEVSFYTPALSAFRPYPLTVTLEAKKHLSPTRWLDLIKTLNVYPE